MEPTPTATTPTQRTCFVVMGFGKKIDFETGRTLDLDMSYQNMIKPAVEAAGLRCIRADEIVHSGMIDVPMYQWLLNADVVVADLSTSNKNAFYELGVRHALRPSTTIIVAEDGIKTFPFDVNHVAVRQYHHLGEDIGSSEARRFQKLLTDAIQQILAKTPTDQDSPVYTFLQGLTPPALKELQAAVQSATPVAEDALPATAAPDATAATHSMLMAQVDDAQKQGNWLQVKTLLEVIRSMQAQGRQKMKQADAEVLAPDAPEDPYLLQRLALATYKSKLPTEEAALLAARDVLKPLDPATTHNTETLGMWGSVHKRLWELAKATGGAAAPQFLDEAIRAYERGYYLRNDYYNGINFAFLLNARAAEAASPAEAIADYVLAQRVRKEVIAICEQWLTRHPADTPDEAGQPADDQYKGAAKRYWVLATRGEAYAGLGQEEQANAILQEAYGLAPDGWMKTSTEEQLAKLRAVLATNPLRFIAAPATGQPA
ncbi:TRAFs-binding domain-containing protein [Hymenobacter ruricola]|uniref:DUF4071 domain-containing protein n=1 Tax=Hymenobacter ruricola TaxID=2791023 RepID=A0ABS0IA74_9BACT|nr:TRAFs-binding domain-containing protein [Hymenobacter ruricola]MBF9223869.1 DUF4071 domain-containing protein [Hymenobacter ruricola]